MKDLFDLKGKVAIVTGGNGGIGLGVARGLASAGAGVAIAARNEAKTDEAVKGLRDEFGVRVLGVKVDVREESQVKDMVKKVLDEFGRIDILVNNAGTNIRKFPQEYVVDEWEEVLNVNLRSAFLCSQAVYPAMKAAGAGKVINIGSMTSIFGAAKVMLYSTSKGGIVQMGRCMANAWAKDNIQVNAILPGFIDTDLTRKARKDMPELNERVNMRTPAGRWGMPDDLAGTAVFLASRASDFVTGVALPVDGGFSVAML
jgi:2-deoxy-D-gluconate 3-dehydrogenase